MEEKKQAYKTKYQKEKLKRIYVDVKKEFGVQFDKTLKEQGLDRSDIIVPAMIDFLENPKKFKKV